MRDVFTDKRPCHSHLLPSLQPERSEHQTIRAVRGCKARDLASLILHHAAPTASVWASPLAPRVRTARRAAVDGRRGPAHGPFDSFGWPGLAVSPLSRLGRKGLPGSRFIVVEPAAASHLSSEPAATRSPQENGANASEPIQRDAKDTLTWPFHFRSRSWLRRVAVSPGRATA